MWAPLGVRIHQTAVADGRRPPPQDTRTAELVGELSMKSEPFRRWWAAQKVGELTHDTKLLRHPIVGPLTLRTEALLLPGDPDQTLITFLPDHGSPSDEALRVLSAWVADHGSDANPDLNAVIVS